MTRLSVAAWQAGAITVLYVMGYASGAAGAALALALRH